MLYNFRRVYGREPAHWPDFVAGTSHLARADARESLRLASAASVPMMKQEAADEWYHTQRAAAGWSHG